MMLYLDIRFLITNCSHHNYDKVLMILYCLDDLSRESVWKQDSASVFSVTPCPVAEVCRYPSGTLTSVRVCRYSDQCRGIQVPFRYPDQCLGYAGTLTSVGVCGYPAKCQGMQVVFMNSDQCLGYAGILQVL